MKTGQTPLKLAQKIKQAIYSISDDTIQEEIISKIVNLGGSRGDISDILEGNTLLETLPLIELGVLAKIIHEVTNIGFIKPGIFLEEAEMDQVKSYRFKQESVSKNLLVFENVLQVSHDIWTTVVPAKRIADLYRNNAVGYNFETQREAKNITDGNSIIKVANVNWNAVEKIQEELVKGLFIPNEITFNVPIEHAESIKFNKNAMILEITENVLTILDGFHRSLAIIGALRVVEDLNINFEVRITCFDVDKAQQFIVQEDKRNPINKTYLKSIDSTDRITTIVNSLNQSNESELRGMIATDKSLITTGNALVSYDFAHDLVAELWNPSTMLEVRQVTEHLISFFNTLVGTYPVELKDNIRASKRATHINNEQMFLLYFMLAKELMEVDGWSNNLKTMIQSIGKDKTNEIINTPVSIIRQNMGNYTQVADNIVKGVLKNERQAI